MEDETPYLIFAKRVAIHRTNLNGTDFDTIITNSSFTSNAIAIDFDARYNTPCMPYAVEPPIKDSLY